MNENEEPQTQVTDEKFKDGILHRLNELKKANIRCDTILRVEGQMFPAHSHVLYAASDYFRALFSSELQVKEKQENVVELKVVKSTIMEEVLEFIYTGQASISYSSAHELLVASDYLIIPSLKSQTSQFLEKSMNVSNCFTLESFACQFNCDSLRQTAIKFMNENFVAVVKSEDFLILEFNKVKELICRDELNISEEEEVYEAVLTWVKHDLSSRECFLADLLKCLRVFSLSKYSIDRILKKEELVKKSLTCIAIMNTGLEYFLYPDRFLGSVLKHRNSIEKDEHVVLLHDGVEINADAISKDVYCFVLSTKKWQQLCSIPPFIDDDCADLVSAVCFGCVYMLTDVLKICCFNPQKNSWKSKETEYFCQELAEFTVTSFNEELYVIGGHDEYLNAVRTVLKYNPVCNEWKKLASMETGRRGHCAVVLEDLIYVIGGVDGGTCLKSVESFDPSTNQWKKVPDLANARRDPAAATVCGKIVVVGGFRNTRLSTSSVVEPTCEVFDPFLNQWSSLSSPNVPRAACGIVSVGDTVYVFGGYGEGSALDSVEHYDAKCNEWQKVDTKMPKAKGFIRASLVKLPKEFICND